ncbi:cyclic nucleotide-binding domain-containing protein [Thermodesulfobacteriota bacterium]
MISRDDLKQMVMLAHMSDEMLDQMIPITEMNQFDAKDYVFRQGDLADRFYFLVKGKVLLEKRISPEIAISLSSIKPDFSFGWSALLDDENYTMDAVCAEPSQVLSYRAAKLKALSENDHSFGYIMSQRLLRVIKKRYNTVTEQFIKAIRHHPDLGSLL